jgi:hypothetical protein
VLLLFAMRGKRRRVLLFLFGAPTALGLALSGLSCAIATQRFGGRSIDGVILGFAATLVARLVRQSANRSLEQTLRKITSTSP